MANANEIVGVGAVMLFIYGTVVAREGSDILFGGKADKYRPSDFSKTQLKKGTKVELEHTNDRQLAREIAMDHLREDPDYYKALAKMERDLKRKRSRRK